MRMDRKEIARALMALGSIPFLILVMVRIIIAENFREVFHIAAAVALLGIVSFGIKGINHHSARIVVLAIFTSVYYGTYMYASFAVLIAITALYGLREYLKKEKVYSSAFIGIACSAISYLMSSPLDIG